ncbi:bifunctional riboflavin kinase/FAD synthetase [Alicyclobacillus shizuokensis]|uniref:bifunctional riboflavin kinase/FAD synthetase n=1 Tax=Alicyclobacillus shizuokensis TaxID=392014 RepID=UPI0008356CF1|nr:bifunctional riboflavin kinase/FAD synthetase [Alicyclobacillus shizuokensis]MCL6626462.1 bifunctional riboflavin kinase/FAD synthetase [Alicyclobacillus shizuokensis]
MQVIDVKDRPPARDRACVMAIGKFDGVHIGHQAILQAARQAEPQAELAVYSLWPHPAWVLGGREEYRASLTPYAEKVRQMRALGVDVLYMVEFSRTYAKTSAETFVRDHLGPLRPCRVVVGSDFHFGQGGRADVEDLRRLCAELGVPVSVVDHVEENGLKVSSSHIREHLAYGRVEAAEALLGRPYRIEGRVVHGDARGRTIGFPTANLELLDEYVLPAPGVYAVSVEWDELEQERREHTRRRNWFGVLNAGYRPTVDGREFRLETHLFGVEQDLYDRILTVSFLRRVREERKFAGLEELREQIARDVAKVKDMLGVRGN